MGQHLSPTVNIIDAISANDSIQYQFDMSDIKYKKLNDNVIIKEILNDIIDQVLHNIVSNNECNCYE